MILSRLDVLQEICGETIFWPQNQHDVGFNSNTPLVYKGYTLELLYNKTLYFNFELECVFGNLPKDEEELYKYPHQIFEYGKRGEVKEKLDSVIKRIQTEWKLKHPNKNHKKIYLISGFDKKYPEAHDRFAAIPSSYMFTNPEFIQSRVKVDGEYL